MPIQQMLLGVGAATKTYIEDLFTTVLYKGTGSSQTISTGINQSGKGALTWIKERSGTQDNILVDSVRGPTKRLVSNGSGSESTDNSVVSAFTGSGFTVGDSAKTNDNGETFASWTFRKAPGFFDIVTYTGDGTKRAIAHSLGSIPGMILVKRTDDTYNWGVYHRGLNNGVNPEKYRQRLNIAGTEDGDNENGYSYWADTAPTSTHFTVSDGTSGGQGTNTNISGAEYIAYVFAGGESTAATARSVDFDGSGDSLTISNHADINVGTGDYTLECSFNFTGSFSGYIGIIGRFGSSEGYYLQLDSNGKVIGGEAGGSWVTSSQINRGAWNHVALVRQSGAVYLYLNGLLQGTVSGNGDLDNTSTFGIGDLPGYNRYFTGKISNVRLVKGTAVYTSSFKPPTAPLTSITNTKILCCNNSSTTGSTVTPGTITANGDPTASTDSPFDDPAGFVFGDAEDQNVIKCGSYVGTNSATNLEINLGWEPEFLIIKDSNASENWFMLDSMRGIVSNANDFLLRPSTDGAENESAQVDLTPTGFKITSIAGGFNTENNTHIYIAIRRSDGYVGKPPSLGTGVFAMDTGSSASLPPGSFDSGFPVDIGIYRQPASVADWILSTRLTGNKFLETNTTDAESTDSGSKFDSNTGWYDTASGSYQSWMWKRHAGFDVVAYKGDGVAGKQISHSLSKIPEMIWVKNSDRSEAWRVYHKGLNGGTTPHNYGMKLNTSDAESAVTIWNQTAPTSTHFTINADSGVNYDGEDMRAFLFASVAGISKVGTYDGTGSSGLSVTTGFQPRYLLIKRTNAGSTNWNVYDSVRGFSSGNDSILYLDTTQAAVTNTDIGEFTSTGFTINETYNDINHSSGKYIYYAHA